MQDGAAIRSMELQEKKTKKIKVYRKFDPTGKGVC